MCQNYYFNLTIDPKNVKIKVISRQNEKITKFFFLFFQIKYIEILMYSVGPLGLMGKSPIAPGKQAIDFFKYYKIS